MMVLEGPCLVQPCGFSAGFYLGPARGWICWLHAIELGWDEKTSTTSATTSYNESNGDTT